MSQHDCFRTMEDMTNHFFIAFAQITYFRILHPLLLSQSNVKILPEQLPMGRNSPSSRPKDFRPSFQQMPLNFQWKRTNKESPMVDLSCEPRFQRAPSIICSHILAIHTSLEEAIESSIGKASPQGSSPLPIHSKLYPLPITYPKACFAFKAFSPTFDDVPYPHLIPYPHFSRAHPSSSSYFLEITRFQWVSLLQANLHNHFPSRALRRMNKLLIPKPPHLFF